MDPIMSTINETVLQQVLTPLNSSEYQSSNPPTVSGFNFGGVLGQLWSLITIWRLLILFLVLGNLKNVPLIWHLRIVNAFRFVLRTQRPKVPVTSAQLFQPIITTTHAPLLEIDFNLHKTNSSYFSDIDIARTHLVCTLFSTGIEKMRGGTAAITGTKRQLFGLALGAVSCSFKRELKPYESYEMWTRVLSWDEKWIYIVTHFVRKGAVVPSNYTLYPQQNSSEQESFSRRSSTSSMDSQDGNEAVVATALSKCVFKQGRRTISPAFMLKASGLMPAESLDEAVKATHAHNHVSCASSDSGIELDDSDEESELERVESERQRGLKVALSLAAQAQNALEMEFTAQSEALGRHSDGTGITGVMSTLAQLAHLKRKQSL